MLRLRRLYALALVAALALALSGGPARACDTPVFRFAMYSPQWAPWPYVVFSFGDGQGDKDAERVNQLLRAAERDRDGVPNLRFAPVDPADAAALEGLPAAVRKVYESRPDKRPFHVVVNPRGEVVYSGGLTTADVQGMLDSPARRELGRLMSQGNVVFLLLEGKDAKANQVAEGMVNEVIRLVGEGQLDGLTPSGASNAGTAERTPRKGDASSAKPKDASKSGAASPPGTAPKVALLKVSRGDAKEAWLVRMLMRADRDLDEVAERPMVFPVYGRARALPPCIGEGITRENLLHEQFGLRFLAGPCSCEVKDGNPGTDLLTSIDWPRVAADMARLYGDEDSADRLGDVTSLVPRLDGARTSATTPLPAGGDGKRAPGGLLANLNPPTEPAAANVPAESASASSNDSPAEPSAAAQPSAAARSLKPIGILVACMAAAAVLASLLLFRPGGRS
jgi:hypothetical protein